jgi:hypothetical protein
MIQHEGRWVAIVMLLLIAVGIMVLSQSDNKEFKPGGCAFYVQQEGC